MSSTEQNAEPPTRQFPSNPAAFARIVLGIKGEAYREVRDVTEEMAELGKVRDDELVVLHRMFPHHDNATLIQGEISRRTIAALVRTEAVIKESLDVTRQNLEEVKRNREAVQQSTASIDELGGHLDLVRAAADRWSKWLTRLTIGICGLTAVLVILVISSTFK